MGSKRRQAVVYYMQRLDTFNAPVTAINLAILVCLFYDFGLIYLYSVVLKFCFVNKKLRKQNTLLSNL